MDADGRRMSIAGPVITAVLAAAVCGCASSEGGLASEVVTASPGADGERGCPAMVSTDHVNGFAGSDILGVKPNCATYVLVGGPTFDYYPALSRDGSKLTFVRYQEGRGTLLMVLDVSSSELRQVASTPDALGSPEFSPDGREIAFWLNNGSGHSHIYTVATEGGEPRRLTSGASNEVWPTWSPDGGTVAFVRGQGELVTVDVVTRTQSALTKAPNGLKFPFWAANGESVFAVQPVATARQSGDPRAPFRLVMLDGDTGELHARSPLIQQAFVDAVSSAGGVELATSDDLLVTTVSALDPGFETLNDSVIVKGEPNFVAGVSGG